LPGFSRGCVLFCYEPPPILRSGPVLIPGVFSGLSREASRVPSVFSFPRPVQNFSPMLSCFFTVSFLLREAVYSFFRLLFDVCCLCCLCCPSFPSEGHRPGLAWSLLSFFCVSASPPGAGVPGRPSFLPIPTGVGTHFLFLVPRRVFSLLFRLLLRCAVFFLFHCPGVWFVPPVCRAPCSQGFFHVSPY